jgi:hypothetical protein
MAMKVIPQPTPNPHAYKFTLDGHTFARPVTVGSAEAAEGTPFATLFAVPGVLSVFATSNFVTVTKDPGLGWQAIVGPVREALEQAF